jgi:mono/diheme cytochrome c family protein
MVAMLGCHDDMYNQPRYEPLEPSSFFDDGRSSRQLVPGTIPRDALPSDSVLITGKENGQLVATLPVELSEALLRRGQERFNIFCSVCHGQTGDGNGMIVQRGFTRPPTFHSERLRGAPIGHFFDVATHGFGRMPAYAAQVPVEDRWAIAAYIRTLQLSQYAEVNELPTL